MSDQPSPAPRRATAGGEPSLLEVWVGGETFQVMHDRPRDLVAPEWAASLAEGRVLTLPLSDGRTLLINGRTVLTLVVGAVQSTPVPPRRAIIDP